MNSGNTSSNGRTINVVGLAAGALMIILPFLGPWWIASVGTGAFEISLSPFDLSIMVFGQPIHSQLVGLLLLAAKIAMIISGVFLILGSLSPKSWWSGRLVRFGVMKPLWAVIGIIIVVVLGAFFINNVLPGILSNAIPDGGASVQITVPYLVGSASATIQMGSQASITAPINLSLTPVFWVAVVTAILGIVARINHRRLKKQ
jgi:low affinity Fe/Cu permease